MPLNSVQNHAAGFYQYECYFLFRSGVRVPYMEEKSSFNISGGTFRAYDIIASTTHRRVGKVLSFF
jgi:hypothetical protein